MDQESIETISSILSTCVWVFAFIANITTCVVILYSRSMYIVTSIYLFSLSIADLLILISHGSERLYVYLHFAGHDDLDEITLIINRMRRWYFIIVWLFRTSVNASSLTLTTFTCERYIAICHPFVSQGMSKKSRVIKIIIILWLASALLALVPAAKWFNLRKHEESGLLEPVMEKSVLREIILTSLNFFLPMILITVMYILIGIELKKSYVIEQDAVANDNRDTKKMLKMFVFIVVTFFLCWAPYYVVTIIESTDAPVFEEDHLFRVTNVYKVVQYLDSIKKVTCDVYPALNPLIYTLMSEKFRGAFKNLLTKAGNKIFDSAPKSTDTQMDSI